MREMKKLVEMLQAQTKAREMAELQKAEAEQDKKDKERKEGKKDGDLMTKNVESLLRRMEKMEKKKDELVKEDSSEQKQIDGLKKMIEAFSAKVTQVSNSASNSPVPTGRQMDSDLAEDIKNLQM